MNKNKPTQVEPKNIRATEVGTSAELGMNDKIGTIGILILFLIFVNIQKSTAQDYIGFVYDKESNKPLEYVCIGVINKSNGTIADENGQFHIKIENKFLDDSIRFSLIGYDSKKMLVKDFVHNALKGNLKIYLVKKSYNLKEVDIRPKIYKQKVIGNSSSTLNIFSCLNDTAGTGIRIGCEYGTLMKIPKSPCFIDDIKIKITECSFDSVLFRLNIYSIDDNSNIENILRWPIYVYFTSTNDIEYKTIDLKEYGLETSTNFIATLEFIKIKGKGTICFGYNFFGSIGYNRVNGQDDWIKSENNISISSTVTYEK